MFALFPRVGDWYCQPESDASKLEKQPARTNTAATHFFCLHFAMLPSVATDIAVILKRRSLRIRTTNSKAGPFRGKIALW